MGDFFSTFQIWGYNILDIVFFVLCGGSVLLGVHGGFIRSLAEFAGSLISFIGAVALSPLAAKAFASVILKTQVMTASEFLFMKMLAMVVLFVILQLLVHFVAQALDAVFSLPLLNLTNKLLGGLFGLLRGAIFIVVICLLVRAFMPEDHSVGAKKTWQTITGSSAIYSYFQSHDPVPYFFGMIESQTAKLV